MITGVAGIRADGATGTIPRVDSYSYNAPRDWRLDFESVLDPSTLTLLIASANISDVSGNRLDGEWEESVDTASGDGIVGGDFSFTMYALPGDESQRYRGCRRLALIPVRETLPARFTTTWAT